MRAHRAPDAFSTRAHREAAATRPSRVGSILGASAAALISGALIYWIGAGRDPRSGGPEETVVAPPSVVYAPARPDPAEVVRAREQLQDVFAQGGEPAVAHFGQQCAASLARDPKSLDFCISFNEFADKLGKVPASVHEAERLALVRAALPPEQDPRSRLDELRLLAGEVSVADVTRPQRVAPRREADRRSPKAPKTAPRSHEARLQSAYKRAAAAGVNPSVLGREQRQFRRAVQGAGDDRAAVARLFERRIRSLEAQARRARS